MKAHHLLLSALLITSPLLADIIPSGKGKTIVKETVTIITEDTTKTEPQPEPDNYDGPRIQIALLLDTSNSMDGLIAQAKSQLWKIVNEFIGYEHNGQTPRLEVALYEYGNDGLPQSVGYIRRVSSFTTELDVISEKLFDLDTNGGSEFCGQVISDAVADLDWKDGDEHLRAIFIAGNEAFTQGNTDYRNSVNRAAEKDIVVNTIHCGNYDEGINGKWRDGAVIGKGKYINIDQNRDIEHIAAPQDDRIAELGVALNNTYLPYGARGKAAARNQKVQDSNAFSSSFGGIATQRAVTKSSGYYKNTSWDLVDAYNEDQINLDDIAEEDLPEQLRGLSEQEQIAVIKEMEAERKQLKEQIQTLNAEREQYVIEERQRRAEAGEGEAETFDKALIDSLREQAESKGYQKK